jgi:hypothetical protein
MADAQLRGQDVSRVSPRGCRVSTEGRYGAA